MKILVSCRLPMPTDKREIFCSVRKNAPDSEKMSRCFATGAAYPSMQLIHLLRNAFSARAHRVCKR